MMVSMTVHDKKVCFKLRLKNSLNIQNPESLICEPNTLPAPTASTISSGEAPLAASSGDTTPAAVMAATLAEPIVTLSRAVTSHANNKGGKCHSLLRLAISLPAPLSCNTCFHTPPAVIISSIIAIPDIPLLTHVITVCISEPALNPK